MQAIYKPKGRAGEYGDYAINIYTGCNHGCAYCYAAKMARRFGRDFTTVAPRQHLLETVQAQLAGMRGAGRTIHLCFTCDPYPAPPVDTTITREIIRAIKASGNRVQILTKAGLRAMRDFDLLDAGDSFGVTVAGSAERSAGMEPGAESVYKRLTALNAARDLGIKTWLSLEPVYDPEEVYALIAKYGPIGVKLKIGMLNHYKSPIDWQAFGLKCKELCEYYRADYQIKNDLLEKMEASK